MSLDELLSSERLSELETIMLFKIVKTLQKLGFVYIRLISKLFL